MEKLQGSEVADELEATRSRPRSDPSGPQLTQMKHKYRGENISICSKTLAEDAGHAEVEAGTEEVCKIGEYCCLQDGSTCGHFAGGRIT